MKRATQNRRIKANPRAVSQTRLKAAKSIRILLLPTTVALGCPESFLQQGSSANEDRSGEGGCIELAIRQGGVEGRGSGRATSRLGTRGGSASGRSRGTSLSSSDKSSGGGTGGGSASARWKYQSM